MVFVARLRIEGRRLFSVPLLGLLLASCQGEAPQVGVEEGGVVSHIGDPAASELLRTLVGHLNNAMEEGGPANAIEFCSAEAIPITETVQASLEEGLVLKRTSFRYRNPRNAPDEAEEAALRYFEEVIGAGDSSPSGYVQKVSEEEFRYYKPLFLGEVCLQCHGDREAMDPQLQDILLQKYPGDLAMGYAAGDFRGVVRVTVPASKVAAGAQG